MITNAWVQLSGPDGEPLGEPIPLEMEWDEVAEVWRNATPVSVPYPATGKLGMRWSAASASDAVFTDISFVGRQEPDA